MFVMNDRLKLLRKRMFCGLFISVLLSLLLCTRPVLASTETITTTTAAEMTAVTATITGIEKTEITPNTTSFAEVSQNFSHFFQNAQQVTQAILNNPNLTHFADMLWKFFAVISIVWFFALYTMNGASVSKLFTVFFMILLTRVLMNQYDMMTTALWGWSEGFASGIQQAATGQSDLLWLVKYIWHTCTAMSFGSPSIVYNTLAFLASLFMMLLTALLICLSAFVSIWALWGYALMKMIGFMFIPCLLFENLSWLFDGWFRCFIGFLLYNVIARANLVLIVMIFKNYFHTTMTVPDEGIVFVFHNISEGIGLFCFLIIGIIALYSTSGLVRSIISVSHIGISDGARKLAYTVGSMAAFL